MKGNSREEKIEEIVVEALDGLHVDDELAAQIKARLRESHNEESASEVKETKRLQNELARKTKHLGLVYDDRLRDVITVELYKAKRDEIQADIDRIQADLAKLKAHNVKYMDEGITILELLKGIKDVYVAQDAEGKAQTLDVILDKIVLRGKEAHVVWKQPFSYLFDLNRVIQKSGWGE